MLLLYFYNSIAFELLLLQLKKPPSLSAYVEAQDMWTKPEPRRKASWNLRSVQERKAADWDILGWGL